MTPLARASRFSRVPLSFCLVSAAAFVLGAQASRAQKAGPKTAPPPIAVPDRASSYYHYSLAHLYEDMAVNAGRSDYATQAIEQYKLALNDDPNSRLLQNGLADLYFKLGRIREAVTAAQEQILKDPNDLAAHTLLGKVYLRSLGDMQNQQSGEMLSLAIAEYEKLVELKPDNVETHLLLGQLYGLNHDSAKAEAQFKAAQKLDSNSEEVVLNMARLYGEQGDLQRSVSTLAGVPTDDRTARIDLALGAAHDQLKHFREAAAAYRAALELEPENTLEVQRALANALLNDGQIEQALPLFQKIVAAEPQDAQSQIHIADIERREGHYDQALATLERAKPLAQDSLELSYNEALIYDSLGRFKDATELLSKLVADATHADGKYSDQEKSVRYLLLDRLAIIDREQGKTADTIAAYKQVGQMGGEYTLRGYQGQVDTYREAHQWKDATAVAGEAANALPKDRGVQLMYAGQLADTGKPEEGIALAKAQLAGGAEDREIDIALAQIYLRQKQYDEARAQVDKAAALTSKPDDLWLVYYLRGTIADQQKLYDEAEANFRKALTIDPLNATVLNNLGYMFADRGVRIPEAIVLIKKAVDLEPQNYAFLDSLGWAYFKSGQLSLAEENLRKANERSSTDPTVHDHLGDVYERNGKLKLAAAQWERSMTEYAHSLPADADAAEVEKVQHKLQNARIKLAKAGPAPTPNTAKNPK